MGHKSKVARPASFASGHMVSPHVFYSYVDNHSVHTRALAERRRESAMRLMVKYFIFERLQSGRLLWMGEAEDFEGAQAKLVTLLEQNPGCIYFAFDIETGAKIKINSYSDDE